MPHQIDGRSQMNTNELIAKVADAHSVSKAQAKSIVEDILKNIQDAAASGGEVSLLGFGKFKVKATPEREGNPASGEKIKIAASNQLTFSSAKSVKDLLERLRRTSAKRQEAEQLGVLQSGAELVASARLEIEPFLELDLRDRPGRVQVNVVRPVFWTRDCIMRRA